MRKVTPVLYCCAVFLSVIIACSKNDSSSSAGPRAPADTADEETPPPDAPPSAGSAPYSGRWSGTITVTDIDSAYCVHPDKLLETAQGWTVRGDSVQVSEIIVVNSERQTFYWRGTIRNDTLQMESKRYERCAGQISLRQLRLKAPITMVNNTYSLEGFTVYNLCEPNCRFEYAYQLRKE